jgi:hypothetical protein
VLPFNRFLLMEGRTIFPVSSALQGSDATHAVGLKAATPTGNTGPVPVENLPHQDQPEDSDEASDWDSDVSTDGKR